MKQKRLATFHRAALMLLFAVLGSAGTWAAPDGDELPAPTDLEVYDVNEHGAWLRWKSDAKNWLISLSTNPGTDIYDGWYRISEDTSYELTGLDSEKEYYVSVCAIEVKAGAMGMMYIVKQSEPSRCSFVTHSEGAGEQEDPNGGEQEDPGAGEQEDPGNDDPDDPSAGEQDDPGNDDPDDPGSGEQEDPGNDDPDDPGAGEQEDPDSGESEDPAAIKTIGLHSADTFWFTLDGRRLTDKPTRKGVYIHLGKKQVVK